MCFPFVWSIPILSALLGCISLNENSFCASVCVSIRCVILLNVLRPNILLFHHLIQHLIQHILLLNITLRDGHRLRRLLLACCAVGLLYLLWLTLRIRNLPLYALVKRFLSSLLILFILLNQLVEIPIRIFLFTYLMRCRIPGQPIAHLTHEHIVNGIGLL